ncbi:hypothetical protein EGR_09001 [Echinococcus granulosus]|uniref:Uncharacterized protein n=1 Tax=Echinococcus granulosus TaxID=6210 RepID=W6U6Z8_ECHGR|nr:hypothetical protein EGR_09001 [Echinococcus granulosus]EUB56151.1 hypothetical protein EGR_09001 [Echinococcus granulosus]
MEKVEFTLARIFFTILVRFLDCVLVWLFVNKNDLYEFLSQAVSFLSSIIGKLNLFLFMWMPISNPCACAIKKILETLSLKFILNVPTHLNLNLSLHQNGKIYNLFHITFNGLNFEMANIFQLGLKFLILMQGKITQKLINGFKLSYHVLTFLLKANENIVYSGAFSGISVQDPLWYQSSTGNSWTRQESILIRQPAQNSRRLYCFVENQCHGSRHKPVLNGCATDCMHWNLLCDASVIATSHTAVTEMTIKQMFKHHVRLITFTSEMLQLLFSCTPRKLRIIYYLLDIQEVLNTYEQPNHIPIMNALQSLLENNNANYISRSDLFFVDKLHGVNSVYEME